MSPRSRADQPARAQRHLEAARFGEAGKGFAVTANEVEELAQETGRATEDIARRVEAIQVDTGGAVTAIGTTSTIVTSINDHQLTIASAVHEDRTTNEMARNVTEAATGSGEIATNTIRAPRPRARPPRPRPDAVGRRRARMAGHLRTMIVRFRY